MAGNLPQCPVCFSTKSSPVGPNYYLCKNCRISFNENYAPREYDHDYFLEDYQSQYGKTYIQDFENITALSRKRLGMIFKYAAKEPSTLNLLEIGSAAGFFLQSAKEFGIQHLTGIEISHYAASYCRDKFNIPVLQSSFEDIQLHRQYDIIAAWFFIEHCAYPRAILQKIYNSLADGGIFAFSGPSIFGPLYTFNRTSWVDSHPVDHRIDFSPRSVKNILKTLGFKSVHIKPSGVHPERMFSEQNALFKLFAALYRIFSSATAFSDTIEVYAIK